MEADQIAVELRKIANLLAINQTEKLSKTDRVVVLKLCGFSNREIATLIGTTEGSIRAMLSSSRKRGPAAEE